MYVSSCHVGNEWNYADVFSHMVIYYVMFCEFCFHHHTLQNTALQWFSFNKIIKHTTVTKLAFAFTKIYKHNMSTFCTYSLLQDTCKNSDRIKIWDLTYCGLPVKIDCVCNPIILHARPSLSPAAFLVCSFFVFSVVFFHTLFKNTLFQVESNLILLFSPHWVGLSSPFLMILWFFFYRCW